MPNSILRLVFLSMLNLNSWNSFFFFLSIIWVNNWKWRICLVAGSLYRILSLKHNVLDSFISYWQYASHYRLRSTKAVIFKINVWMFMLHKERWCYWTAVIDLYGDGALQIHSWCQPQFFLFSLSFVILQVEIWKRVSFKGWFLNVVPWLSCPHILKIVTVTFIMCFLHASCLFKHIWAFNLENTHMG